MVRSDNYHLHVKAEIARYDPIQKFGPQDCVASVNAIVDKVDLVFASGNATAIHEMKAVFGLETLADNRDFAATIAFPLGKHADGQRSNYSSVD